MPRIIGIRHRVKRTADGEPRPTQVCVCTGKRDKRYDLKTETDELDWVLGQYPLKWRLADKDADAAFVKECKEGRRKHHLRWRSVRKNEDAKELQKSHIVEEQEGKLSVLQIPAVCDGLKQGDVVAMVLGGSGDRLAFALSRQAETLGKRTTVLRAKPMTLKAVREGVDGRTKDDDALTLVEMVQDGSVEFFPVTRRDRDLIWLRETWENRVQAMKARIGAEQRLRAHIVGRIFCSHEGKYPEGEIEVVFELARSNDAVIQALEMEEKARNREVANTLKGLDVYTDLLAKVTGIGPMIAARIIVAIGDIRRFATPAKLKAFLGVHVMQGGRYGERPTSKQFVRRRQGEVANWHPDGRQALFLVADQWNRNPQSDWGRRFRMYKKALRERHPDVECKMCEVAWDACEHQGSSGHVRRYGDGHIHKMAQWRTVTRFVEWLWREWTRLEEAQARKPENRVV